MIAADELAIFCITRDPEMIEIERFGNVNILANLWVGRKHREMVKTHESRAREYWGRKNGKLEINNIQTKAPKCNKMSKEQLEYARALADKIRKENKDG